MISPSVTCGMTDVNVLKEDDIMLQCDYQPQTIKDAKLVGHFHSLEIMECSQEDSLPLSIMMCMCVKRVLCVHVREYIVRV